MLIKPLKSNSKQQTGVILFTSMLLLLLASVVVMAAMQANLLSIKISHQYHLQQQLLQASESALKQSEQFLSQYYTDIIQQIIVETASTREATPQAKQCRAVYQNQAGICSPVDRDPATASNAVRHWQYDSPVWQNQQQYRLSNQALNNIQSKTIIEFLGYFTSPNGSHCSTSSSSPDYDAFADQWPFCRFDYPSFRITTLTQSLNNRLQLQSIIIIDPASNKFDRLLWQQLTI